MANSYVGKIEIGSDTHLVGSTLYGTCSTAAGTPTKEVTLANFDKAMTGVTVHVKFTNSNTSTGTIKMKVNNLAEAPLIFATGKAPGTTENTSWSPGAVITATYDGSNWVINGVTGGAGEKIFYGTCSVAASTASKTVVLENGAVDGVDLVPGIVLHVYFVNTNTASNPEIAISGWTNTKISRYGTTAPGNTPQTSWEAGSVKTFTYADTDTSSTIAYRWVMNDYRDVKVTTTTDSGAAFSISGTTLYLTSKTFVTDVTQ